MPSEVINQIDFKKNFGSKKKVNLTVTLHRKINKSDMCSTNQLNIKVDRHKTMAFMQTDKPIYRPGENVRFLVVVVDKDLKPFMPNNLKISIIDPFNKTFVHYDGREFMDYGVLNDTFKLADDTIVGNWKIQVEIDKNRLFWTKMFAVDKFVLPLYNAYLKINEKHLIFGEHLEISIYAKYPFGEYVSGSANITISGTNVMYQRSIALNFGEFIKINTKNDLKLTKINITELDIKVEFEEPESGEIVTKTDRFSVHGEKKYHVIASHRNSFIPGIIFAIEVKIYNSKFNRVVELHEKFTVRNFFELNSGEVKISDYFQNLDSDSVIVNIPVPKETESFKFSIEYKDKKLYHNVIGKETVKINKNYLLVDYSPKR